MTVWIIMSILPSCNSLKNGKSENITLRVLNYGRSSAKLLYTEESKSMPSGKKRTTDYQLKILERTDTIKLTKGVQFGIEYILEAPSSRLIKITTIWTYPSTMINDQGNKYSMLKYDIEKYTNQYTYSNYTLEDNYEMIPGKWNLKILYGNTELLNKTFYLKEQ